MLANLSNYFVKHWRGGYSPIVSLFAGGIVAYFAMVSLSKLANRLLAENQSVYIEIAIICFIMSWVMVGTLRSASKAVFNNENTIVSRTTSVLAISLVVLILFALLRDMYFLVTMLEAGSI